MPGPGARCIATTWWPAPSRLNPIWAVVGCSYVDAADTLGDVSTPNVEQLTRTFRGGAALPVKPPFLFFAFFAGALAFGYAPDTPQMARCLGSWRALYGAPPNRRSYATGVTCQSRGHGGVDNAAVLTTASSR